MNTPSTINLPPVWNNVEKHSMLPDAKHDEVARFNFLTNLNKHLSTIVSPANRFAYDKRVLPAFKKQHGRGFENRREVREAMKNDAHSASITLLLCS